MNFAGEIEVKTLELPDALEFTVTREDSLYASVAVPVITSVFLWYFWKLAPPGWTRVILISIAVSSAASYVANRLHGRVTTVRITEDELIAEGNLGRVFSTNLRFAAADMTSIGYYDGGEGGTPGLYVRSGWVYSCMIPGINSEQADSIVDVIAHRFPVLPTEHSHGLHWRGEPLTELGLSKLNRKD